MLAKRAARTDARPIEQLKGIAHEGAGIDARGQPQFEIAAQRDGDSCIERDRRAQVPPSSWNCKVALESMLMPERM